MTAAAADPERVARAALTYLMEPADPVACSLLAQCPAAEVVTAIKTGRYQALPRDPAGGRTFRRWRARLPALPPDRALAAMADRGADVRLVCPGEAEWPAHLDDLGPLRPYALWVRGSGDLRTAAARAVAVVGSRACTGYGAHVAEVLAGELAGQRWTIVSGGAYGIDAAAHRSALHAGGQTVAVLACGVDRPYPAGHAAMFGTISRSGVLVSEWPPGSTPTRLRFLARNRVIAALSQATVVVEAGTRSGALNTARHATSLGRDLMAVPGPVTSAQSAGCHLLIRGGAHLIRDTADIRAVIGT